MKKLLLLLIMLVATTSCGDSNKYTSGRCKATTQEGTQCKRDAEQGSSYCWQHKK